MRGRLPLVLAVVSAVAALWLVVLPLFRAIDEPGVSIVVIGDQAVDQSSDEIARRLRQGGFVPDVVTVGSCRDAVERAADEDVLVVISVADWAGCLPGGEAVVVQSPLAAAVPTEVADAAGGYRPASPLFGAERMPCEWWDIPGPGEVRPGLGKCQPDGLVGVVDSGALTRAGAERFARLITEAVK